MTVQKETTSGQTTQFNPWALLRLWRVIAALGWAMFAVAAYEWLRLILAIGATHG